MGCLPYIQRTQKQTEWAPSDQSMKLKNNIQTKGDEMKCMLSIGVLVLCKILSSQFAMSDLNPVSSTCPASCSYATWMIADDGSKMLVSGTYLTHKLRSGFLAVAGIQGVNSKTGNNQTKENNFK